MSIFPFIDRWRIRRTLRGYIDPKLVRYMIDNPDTELFASRRSDIDFIIALVRDDDLDQLPAIIRRVAEAIPGGTGIFEIMVGPLFLITFGLHQPGPPNSGQRLNAIACLQESLGQQINLLHGRSPALIGNFGAHPYPSHFGSLLPNFNTMLQTLTTLQFGEAHEFPTPPTHAGVEQKA